MQSRRNFIGKVATGLAGAVAANAGWLLTPAGLRDEHLWAPVALGAVILADWAAVEGLAGKGRVPLIAMVQAVVASVVLIYAGWLSSLDSAGVETERWPAAISVGTNPTFDGRHRTVEAYALDRDDLDLYGARVAVDFVARLRATLKFASVDELVAQMHVDVDDVRHLLTAG